jgi:hypothetical protein
MVRAILDGSKTQTRRIIKLPNIAWEEEKQWCFSECFRSLSNPTKYVAAFWKGSHSEIITCPYGGPGDRLWVKETWQAIHISIDPETGRGDDIDYASKIPTSNEGGWWSVVYAATDPEAQSCAEDRGFPWRPPIYMPRWASRITLEITDVRVERLQEINQDDARAEGIVDGGCLNCGNSEPCGCDNPQPDARDAFSWLWQSINGFESWHANPWVWVITFQRLQP